ncbi:hypothetical protein L332_03340 [Agrococcus pavilionensis RW1]|uniref:HNH nuclease domain-containing protein n=1 Tax=Agrococcus pavilionensis RW1 TaxID=1330458 RepID=U1LMD3_9MICO|nr:HNH endonuclease signature motif containing protein [Agrococcus pavilionensis]ERG63489.1 hypothetical protein L332_03340 [Agrococcus pavilionensis RW1]
MNVSDLPDSMPEKVAVVGDCWLWQGAIQSRGYGSVTDGRGSSVLAHRRAYEALVGPIPAGLTLDHVAARGCTSKRCVNPAHLEPVTAGENQRRGLRAKTHCVHGHPLSGANLVVRDRGTHKERSCRICRAAASRRYRERVA